MKIINIDPWPNKVNFVDSSNLLLGYDMGSGCCECYGWFIADQIIPLVPEESKNRDYFTFKVPKKMEEELEDYSFDPCFFAEIKENRMEESMVIFKIYKNDENHERHEKFIHLFNIHNGYYCHGFEFKNETNNITLQEGSI